MLSARCSTQFFAASRLRDLTALRNVSTVVFEPASDGIVTSFEITGIVRATAPDRERCRLPRRCSCSTDER